MLSTDGNERRNTLLLVVTLVGFSSLILLELGLHVVQRISEGVLV